MLSQARFYPTIPAQDMDRARRFYEEVVGLTPGEVSPAGVFYDGVEGTRFLLFPSSGAPSGTHTQMGFRVADLESEVDALRGRGVTFETYDMPGFDPATSIATLPNGRTAWFHDTEGNLIGVVELH